MTTLSDGGYPLRGPGNMVSMVTPVMPNPYDTEVIGQSPSESPLNFYTQSPSRMMPSSPSHMDVNTLRSENRNLKSKVHELQNELQNEQDAVSSLRRRFNNLERDRLDNIAKANEEVSRLDSELTKLRAQVEKGEAQRQNLEYELAMSRKYLGQEKRTASDRELQMTEKNDELTQKVSETTLMLAELSADLESTKQKYERENSQLQATTAHQEQDISALREETDALTTEKQNLHVTLQHRNSTITELEERLEELEDEKRQQMENLKKQLSENEMVREREERRKTDLESALNRMKALEDCIEAERAAHLESKFNSEIIQLRIRDLENALEVEKSSKAKALASGDKLGQQIRELQKVCEDERTSSQVTREKLEKRWSPILRAEKEYMALSRQLQAELEDKKSIIKKLSIQLEIHQKEFDEHKRELNKAKKRQIYIEETYSGSMKELELLVQSFQLDTKPISTSKKKTTQKKKDNLKAQPPSTLLEGLRHMLLSYKRQLDDATADVHRLKSQNEAVSSECVQKQELMKVKDKALETTQQSLTRSNKDLRQIQNERQQVDNRIELLSSELEQTKQNMEKERALNKDLNEQIIRVATKCNTDNEGMVDFLQHMYQQLSLAHRVDCPTSVSFSELTKLINQQVSVVLHNLQRAEERTSYLESLVSDKDHLLGQLQLTNDEQLDKLEKLNQGRSKQWQEEKAELENYYLDRLAEIDARHKKTKSLADEAYDKVRMTGTAQHSLQTECDQLRQEVIRSQQEHDALLSACALLCGAFYPLYSRYTSLVAQRHLLVDQLYKFDAFKHEVQVIVDALCMDQDGQRDQLGMRLPRQRTPLLVFRAGVIAVIAANRLAYLGRRSSRMFTAQDALPGIYSTVVCVGGMEVTDSVYSGLHEERVIEREHPDGEDWTQQWLTSKQLLSTVIATMSDVQTALHAAQQKGSEFEKRHLVNAARNSFQKLLCHLPSTFARVSPYPVNRGQDKTSLLTFLGHGLNRALAHSSLEGSPKLLDSQATLAGLQQHVLEFTHRLHAAEVERRDLRVEVAQLHQARETCREASEDAEQLTAEVLQLRQQLEQTVDQDRFESVCQELEKALYREQQAQHLLDEQGQQIQQLSLKLDMQNSEGNKKDDTLVEVLQSMNQAKNELKQQEQKVRQLTRQVSQLDNEKIRLMENVKDAEHALRTAATDREAVSSYIQSVEKVLENTKTELALSGNTTVTPDFSNLLSIEVKNTGRVGPEVQACQTLVTDFVDAQRYFRCKITSLQEDVQSYKQHIASLKEELSAACQRKFDEQLDKSPSIPYKSGVTTDVRPLHDTPPVDPSYSTCVPLVADTNETFDYHSPVGHKPRGVKSYTRPPVYKTPQGVYKRKTTKRIPTEGRA